MLQLMHGCRHGLVPSIIGKDHGQILIECAHHCLIENSQDNYVVFINVISSVVCQCRDFRESRLSVAIPDHSV